MILSFCVLDNLSLEFTFQYFNLYSFSFFQRSTVREMLQFACKKIVQNNTEHFTRISQVLGGTEYLFFVKLEDTLSFVMCTDDHTYPSSVASHLLGKVGHLPENTVEIIKDYEQYEKHEEIALVQKELEETKIIVTQSLEALITRGESVKGLGRRAELLQGKVSQLLKDASKQNKCCRFF